MGVEQLGLEQADLGLSQGVISVTHGADRRVDAGLGKPAGERDRGVLGGLG
jgi:hypothetical protein